MKTSLIVFAFLLLTGCATEQDVLKPKKQIDFANWVSPEVTKIKKQRDDYLVKPNGDIMFFVASINEDDRNHIQCHLSANGMDQNVSQSFDTLTPFVYLYPVGQGLADMRKNLSTLTASERAALDLMAPHLTMICQSQDPMGIKGKIYANGKVVSEHNANIQYGVVTLSYQMKI